MKKLLSVLLIVAVLAPIVMAEDAVQMPKGVFRLRAIPLYVFGDQAFDSEGEKVDSTEQTIFGLASALEYGINGAATLAFQWSPGWVISGSDESLDAFPGEGTISGTTELLFGVVYQLLGETGLVHNEQFRQAIGVGGIVPTAFSYDAAAEVTAATTGEDFTVHPSNRAPAIGIRSYTDVIINPSMHVNLFGEFKYFFPVAGEDNFTQQLTSVMTGGAVPVAEEIDYGYNLVLNLNYNYSTTLPNGIGISTSLPFIFNTTPEIEYDGTAAADSGTMKLSFEPEINLSFWMLPLPLQTSVSYGLPLWGKNTRADNSVVFQLKAYFAF